MAPQTAEKLQNAVISSLCFGNRTSPSDNSNDRWKRLCLDSLAVAPCVWTL